MSVTVVEVPAPVVAQVDVSEDGVIEVSVVDPGTVQVVEVPAPALDVIVVTINIPGPTAAPEATVVNVVTGNEARPPATSVFWRGGETLPVNFDPDHDIWLKPVPA